ncbi:MAG: hypothetical protein ACI4ML_02950 [Aristaeellaceae bacterium]
MPRRKTLKLSDPQEIRRAISRVANMVLSEEIDTKTANTLLYACNSALNAVRTDEYKNKVEELEALLMAKETGNNL